MKIVRNLILVTIGFTVLFFVAGYCEHQKDPYGQGLHWDYSIECENGFVYKNLGRYKGTIQVLNSDGTPLRCGYKIY